MEKAAELLKCLRTRAIDPHLLQPKKGKQCRASNVGATLSRGKRKAETEDV